MAAAAVAVAAVDDFQVFRKINVNFGYVQIKIGTVQDTKLTKSGEILGQHKVILLTK